MRFCLFSLLASKNFLCNCRRICCERARALEFFLRAMCSYIVAMLTIHKIGISSRTEGKRSSDEIYVKKFKVMPRRFHTFILNFYYVSMPQIVCVMNYKGNLFVDGCGLWLHRHTRIRETKNQPIYDWRKQLSIYKALLKSKMHNTLIYT